MTGIQAAMSLSSCGVVVAATIGDLVSDADDLSKIGISAFMAVCIFVLLYAIRQLCTFIVTILLPLKDALTKFSDTAEQQSKMVGKMYDTVRDCQAKK